MRKAYIAWMPLGNFLFPHWAGEIFHKFLEKFVVQAYSPAGGLACAPQKVELAPLMAGPKSYEMRKRPAPREVSG